MKGNDIMNNELMENARSGANEKLVVKRDGKICPYELSRIRSAVYKAYVEVYHSEEQFKEKIGEIITEVNRRILEKEEQKINIEEIQDIVIEEVNKVDKVVGKAFKDYREERSRVREGNTKLIKSINGLLNFTNNDVILENSNKQAQLISTTRDLMAGEVSKFIVRQMLPKEILDLHDKGIIHIHDMDYGANDMFNCDLVNLQDMLDNGTVINKKKINSPHTLKTAMTVATQISAQVASFQYGGQTMSLSHLAPYVRKSKEVIEKEVELDYPELPQERKDKIVDRKLKKEIKDSVQLFNYQISTIQSTNGQAPFISLCIYLSEREGYEKEVAMLAEEFFKQRIEGMENENGVKATQTFPKLLYFLDENNTYEGSEYFWLTKLAVESTSKRMNPDYISVKKMKENTGFAYPCMGCRAFLSPFKDKNGEWIFYGRGNLGVCSINLPHVALSSNGDIDKFWEILDERLEYCRQVGEWRYNKMKGVKAKVAPILWQHGAIARLNPEDEVIKAIDEKGFTVTLGYSGIYETVKVLTGKSHTTREGYEMAEKIMQHLRSKCEEWKNNQPHLRFALYGTPQESTTETFSKALIRDFGEIEGICGHGKLWVTNSYHVDIQEEINAFDKLTIEGELQKYSTGGAVSYIETYNMCKNQEALLQVVQYMYETIMYAEINFESDICGECHYSGVMDNDPETLDWVCPNCGNRNQDTLSVVRRTCGYLAETNWTKGRKLDILNRVKHL